MSEISIATEQQGEHSRGIPAELQERDQWLVTKNKAPYVPRERWNLPDKQLSFRVAEEIAEKDDGELAFALTPTDPFVVIDFDDVGSDSSFSAEAIGWIEQLNTYSEISRSGTGLHSILRGSRLPSRQESGELGLRGKVEVFDSKQYVVLTGNTLFGFDSIRSATFEREKKENPLLELQRECLPKRNEPVDIDEKDQSLSFSSAPDGQHEVSVDEIYRTIEEYAKTDSREAQRAKRRWHSSAGSSLEFPSASEADLALVADLAFWCRNQEHLIDECFRRSNRARAKWDEPHYSDGRTYGEGTIQTAVRTNFDIFDGHYVTIS